jgi:hypothetical protein
MVCHTIWKTVFELAYFQKVSKLLTRFCLFFWKRSNRQIDTNDLSPTASQICIVGKMYDFFQKTKTKNLFIIFFFSLETGSHISGWPENRYVAQAGLKLVIFLPLPSDCCDYR